MRIIIIISTKECLVMRGGGSRQQLSEFSCLRMLKLLTCSLKCVSNMDITAMHCDNATLPTIVLHVNTMMYDTCTCSMSHRTCKTNIRDIVVQYEMLFSDL